MADLQRPIAVGMNNSEPNVSYLNGVKVIPVSSGSLQ